jgi:hypothetical protein
MLDIDPERPASEPRRAATVVPLRNGPSGCEVFMVRRSAQSRWLGGALVFPGGKLEPEDQTTPIDFAGSPKLQSSLETVDRALFAGALREAFEESFLLLCGKPMPHAQVVELHARMTAGLSFRELLLQEGLVLAGHRLKPWSRWITPRGEARRFDAMFFLAPLVDELEAQLEHDHVEMSESMWIQPQAALGLFEQGKVQIVPPTHRTLEQLCSLRAAEDAWNLSSTLEAICPELVEHVDALGVTQALALPGDPQHTLQTPLVLGKSRYVLRGDQWLPEAAPAPAPC